MTLLIWAFLGLGNLGAAWVNINHSEAKAQEYVLGYTCILATVLCLGFAINEVL